MSNSNFPCPGSRVKITAGSRRTAGRWYPALLALFLALAVGSLSWTGTAHAQETSPPPATVNINTADASALAAALRGVGQSRAMEIVRYREAYGPFESVDELAEVKGIGSATLEANRALITLE